VERSGCGGRGKQSTSSCAAPYSSFPRFQGYGRHFSTPARNKCNKREAALNLPVPVPVPVPRDQDHGQDQDQDRRGHQKAHPGNQKRPRPSPSPSLACDPVRAQSPSPVTSILSRTSPALSFSSSSLLLLLHLTQRLPLVEQTPRPESKQQAPCPRDIGQKGIYRPPRSFLQRPLSINALSHEFPSNPHSPASIRAGLLQRAATFIPIILRQNSRRAKNLRIHRTLAPRTHRQKTSLHAQ
jgi:hypothetical protein